MKRLKLFLHDKLGIPFYLPRYEYTGLDGNKYSQCHCALCGTNDWRHPARETRIRKDKV